MQERREKMVSATFTREQYEAITQVARKTDRTPAAVVRWATLRYLKELGLISFDSIEDMKKAE